MKMISPKYFYDERGSQLFEEITRLPEYYPTETELGIMRDNIGEIAEAAVAGGDADAKRVIEGEQGQWQVRSATRLFAYYDIERAGCRRRVVERL